ncbi:MAG: Cys-tRNA(Pro) deacylase [Oscillospiraceae bacterium]|nr:Cys-tRNA(Pro) deacylase [Oscillospiraceae bacterium]
MAKKEDKTNAMRLLERAGVEYIPHTYDTKDGRIDAVSVAEKCGQDPCRLFKTLVTQGADHGIYVFVIPAAGELDLKAAARAAGVKSIAMLPQARLLPVTGYIHGGCSPVGMKKLFPTVVEESALAQNTIFVSAGRVGAQIELPPAALLKVTNGKTAHVAK